MHCWCLTCCPAPNNSKLFHFRLGKGLSFGKPAGCILGHNEQDVMSSVVRIKKGSWLQGPATRLQQARLDPEQQQHQQQLFRQPEYRIGDTRSNEYITIRWADAAVASFLQDSLLGWCPAGHAQQLLYLYWHKLHLAGSAARTCLDGSAT
jgi:hypothetical protein